MSYEVFPKDELQQRLVAVRRIMKQLDLEAATRYFTHIHIKDFRSGVVISTSIR
jgi:hypothetical protein